MIPSDNSLGASPIIASVSSMPRCSECSKNAENFSARYLRFTLAIAFLLAVWLVILPWIATRPQMDEHLRNLDKQGIDGGAMFYTELEAMKPILRKLESKRP